MTARVSHADRPTTLAEAAAKAKASPGRDVALPNERGIYVRAKRDGTITYPVVAFEDGRNRWRTAATLDAARKLRAKLVSTVEEGGTITRPKPVSLREYAERWLDAQAGTVRPSTLDSYRSHWRTHLEPALGRRKVAQVTTADVRALIAELREAGRARATVRRVLQVLSLMYADAVEERAALSNPVAALSKRDRRAIRPDRTEARRFPVLDREQVAALIAETPEQYRLLLATAVITGLRKGELPGLRWGDLARDAQGEPVLCVRRKLDRKRKGETEATLSTPKTVAGVRDVAIPPALARALAAHRLASRFSGDEDYVFASSVGTPLHERNLLRRALDPAQQAAKLSERLRWHDLRHVAASALIADGASVIYVSRQLGHASASITLDVYGHLFDAAAHASAHRSASEQRYAAVLS